MALTAVVRAAGGVVCREGRVVLVHRPRYDDWTLPKGKAENEESDEACALREVEEETGLVCALEDELPGSEYVDRHGRMKRVRYWRMRVTAGELSPEHEVDDARWCTPAEAADLLTYERDLAVLGAAAL